MTRGQLLALSAYLLAVNAAAFAAFGDDKRRAKAGAWRIRERTLFLLALAGGSLGALFGMWAFRHKTRHWYFRYGLPAIFLAHCAAAWALCIR